MQITQQPITCETPEPEAPSSDSVNDEEDSTIPDTNDNDLDTDYGSGCDLNHSLVSRKIEPFYENCWFTGTTTWFNSKIQKLCVAFEDGTDDYFSNEDIEYVEISLIRSFNIHSS